MKTYFKWQEPKSFARKKQKESIEISFKPFLYRFILGVVLIGFIILGFRFAILKRGGEPSLFVLLEMIIVGGLLIYMVSPFIAVLVSKIFPTTARRVKVSERGVHAIGGNCVSWHYQDIKSFQIRQEHIEKETVDVVELKNFDGQVRAIGLATQIPKNELSTVISERISLAREKVKKALVIPGRGWRTMLGLFLICFGLIMLLAIHSVSSDKEIVEERAQKIEAEAAQITERLESQELSKGHMEVLQETIKLSVSANVELIHRTKILMGISVASSLILLGAVLMLWGSNIYLKNKIARLQAYWADMINNERSEQGSDGNLEAK